MLRDQLLADGACVTCLNSGVTAFPLDPAYHLWLNGHQPVLQLSPSVIKLTATWQKGTWHVA